MQILVEELAIPYRLISAPPGAADAEAVRSSPVRFWSRSGRSPPQRERAHQSVHGRHGRGARTPRRSERSLLLPTQGEAMFSVWPRPPPLVVGPRWPPRHAAGSCPRTYSPCSAPGDGGAVRRASVPSRRRSARPRRAGPSPLAGVGASSRAPPISSRTAAIS
jgi:hypothetical protein